MKTMCVWCGTTTNNALSITHTNTVLLGWIRVVCVLVVLSMNSKVIGKSNGLPAKTFCPPPTLPHSPRASLVVLFLRVTRGSTNLPKLMESVFSFSPFYHCRTQALVAIFNKVGCGFY